MVLQMRIRLYDEDVTCESASEPISGSVSEEISESEWVRVRVTSRVATHVKRKVIFLCSILMRLPIRDKNQEI